eukprot:gene52-3447_t
MAFRRRSRRRCVRSGPQRSTTPSITASNTGTNSAFTAAIHWKELCSRRFVGVPANRRHSVWLGCTPNLQQQQQPQELFPLDFTKRFEALALWGSILPQPLLLCQALLPSRKSFRNTFWLLHQRYNRAVSKIRDSAMTSTTGHVRLTGIPSCISQVYWKACMLLLTLAVYTVFVTPTVVGNAIQDPIPPTGIFELVRFEATFDDSPLYPSN